MIWLTSFLLNNFGCIWRGVVSSLKVVFLYIDENLVIKGNKPIMKQIGTKLLPTRVLDLLWTLSLKKNCEVDLEEERP